MTLSDAALIAPAIDVLRDVFGHDAFHGGPQEAIETSVDGDDSFVPSCSYRPATADRRAAGPQHSSGTT